MTNLDYRGLTEAQKIVLRLVHSGHSTEEIARRLKLKPTSVISRVEGARGKMGGVRRKTAARLLVEYESRLDPKLIGADPQSFTVAGQPSITNMADAATSRGDLQETPTAFEPFPPSCSVDQVNWADRNADALRPVLVIACTLMVLVVLALMKPTAEGFAWLYNAVAPAFNWQGTSR